MRERLDILRTRLALWVAPWLAWEGEPYAFDEEEIVGYITGMGQTLVAVHSERECAGRNCVIHNPSDHNMRHFPTFWRSDRLLMERICPHGVGHPDPDHIEFIFRLRGQEAAQVESIHGCDGCCMKAAA